MDRKLTQPRKKPSIIIWGGWYGSRNIGDRLLLISIAELIRKYLGEFRLVVITARPSLVEEYFKPNPGITWTTLQPLREPFRVISEIARCHLFIFGGGVPFFDQTKQLFIMGVYHSLLRLFRKKYYLWCVSCFKLRNRLAEKVFARVINHSTAVTCRDQFTVDEFNRIGLVQSIAIVPDPVFSISDFDEIEALRLAEKYGLNRKDRYFALSPRTLRFNDTEADTHYNTRTRDDVEKQIRVYSQALDWLVDQGVIPVFITMNTQAPDDDRIAARQMISRSKHSERAILIDEIIQPLAAAPLYRRCEGSLVSRVHGSVNSFLGLCPVIMYAFETKHLGIMQSMDLEDLVYSPQGDPDDQIERLLVRLYKNKSSIQSAMAARKKENEISLLGMSSEVCSMIKD